MNAPKGKIKQRYFCALKAFNFSVVILDHAATIATRFCHQFRLRDTMALAWFSDGSICSPRAASSEEVVEHAGLLCKAYVTVMSGFTQQHEAEGGGGMVQEAAGGSAEAHHYSGGLAGPGKDVSLQQAALLPQLVLSLLFACSLLVSCLNWCVCACAPSHCELVRVRVCVQSLIFYNLTNV